MDDIGVTETEILISEVEKRIKKEFEQAKEEVKQKALKYFKQFSEKDKTWKQMLENGEVTEEQYKNWRTGQMIVGKRWETLRDELADVYVNANEAAKVAVAETLPAIYASNHDYLTFTIEKAAKVNTGYRLIDKGTIERILFTLTEKSQEQRKKEKGKIIQEEKKSVKTPEKSVKRVLQTKDVSEVVKEISDPKINKMFTLYDEPTVTRLIRDNPKVLPPPGKKVTKEIAEGKAKLWDVKQVQSVATQAVLQGEGIDEIAERLAETVGDKDSAAAVRNARTMMTSVQNAGRQAAAERATEKGINITKVWVATLDMRTRHAHRFLDGQRQPIDKPFVVDGNEIMYPGDISAKPHLVYNCFVGDTKVASDSELIRSYKHKYEGELIKVKTAGGVDFTCTPNHPILTPNGWVAANRLNKGDDILVTFIGNRSALRRYSDVNHIHPSMEALHNSLKRMGTVSRDAALTVNFHGDIPTSDVEIVRKKRLLRDNFNSCFGNFFDKFFLKNSDSFAFRASHFVKRFGTIGKSSSSFVSGGRKSLSFFWRRICHSHIHGFGTISRDDFSLTEYPIDDLAAKSVIDGELLYRLSGKIFLDKIVSVDVSVLNTHVYNLQTKNGYYFTNSIIPHNNKKGNGIFAISKNCRCTCITQFKGLEKDIQNYDIRNDPKVNGMTYDEWKQSRETWSKAKQEEYNRQTRK